MRRHTIRIFEEIKKNVLETNINIYLEELEEDYDSDNDCIIDDIDFKTTVLKDEEGLDVMYYTCCVKHSYIVGVIK